MKKSCFENLHANGYSHPKKKKTSWSNCGAEVFIYLGNERFENPTPTRNACWIKTVITCFWIPSSKQKCYFCFVYELWSSPAAAPLGPECISRRRWIFYKVFAADSDISTHFIPLHILPSPFGEGSRQVSFLQTAIRFPVRMQVFAGGPLVHPLRRIPPTLAPARSRGLSDGLNF